MSLWKIYCFKNWDVVGINASLHCTKCFLLYHHPQLSIFPTVVEIPVKQSFTLMHEHKVWSKILTEKGRHKMNIKCHLSFRLWRYLTLGRLWSVLSVWKHICIQCMAQCIQFSYIKLSMTVDVSLSGRCCLANMPMYASTSLFNKSRRTGGVARKEHIWKWLHLFFFSICERAEQGQQMFMCCYLYLHTVPLKMSDCDWPVFMCSCLLLSTQLDTQLKMVRMHLMGPLSWGQVKWPGIMGTGVLYLLLLSTCFGQDTEGKRSLYPSSFFCFHIFLIQVCSVGN